MNMKMLNPLARRVRLMVGRGVVRLVNDDKKMQAVQVSLMANEKRSDIERFQNYGFTSVPLVGAEAAVMFIGGNRDHGVVLAVDDRRYRLKSLKGGEVAIYSDEGDSIILKRGNEIEMNTKTLTINAATKVKIDTPQMEVTGTLMDDTASGNSTSVQGMRDIYNNHTHVGDSGGTTSTPGALME